jgi:hypothetical protein
MKGKPGGPDDGRIITFVRGADKRVTGFTIDLGRIKGLSFAKCRYHERGRRGVRLK